MTHTVLIMAGGTGGHVFPALAAARVLRERGFEPVWLGTHHGLESRLVPAAKIPIEWIDFRGVRGKGVASWLLAPFRLLPAVMQSVRVIVRLHPVVVLGAGGFVSGPGGVAAWLLRKPLVIHEQNAVAGMTNRLLARVATHVLEAFPHSFADRPHVRTVGNPVRREIVALAPPAQRFADHSGPMRLLVFGGSQGSARLNDVVPEALAQLPQSQRPQVIHQAGERHAQSTQERYKQFAVTAQVQPFIDDMARMYSWADLVICRAGALTVSELAVAGIGAILIPFAAAVDDHQTRNAQFLVDADAAVVLAEKELTPQRLAQTLESLFEAGRERLLRMASNARARAIVDADVRLADACVTAAGVAA